MLLFKTCQWSLDQMELLPHMHKWWRGGQIHYECECYIAKKNKRRKECEYRVVSLYVPTVLTFQALFNFVIVLHFSVSINGTNSRLFVSGSCDGTARLWDARVASRAVKTFHGHEGDVNTVKFFPDGNRFGTGSDDGTCRLFDIRTGHQLQVYYQQHGDNDVPHVTSIAFSISGRLLFAGYSNGDCYVWDTLLAKVFCA